MKKLLIFTMFMALSLCFAGEEMTLPLGTQKVLDATGVTSVSPGNARIVSVSVPTDQSKIILKAVGVGTTTVTLIKNDKTSEDILVHVIAKDPNKIMDEVGALLEGVEGVQLKVVGNRVIIDGQVLTQTDNKRIDKVLELYGPQVVKFAEFNQAYLPQEDNILVEFNFVEVNTQKLGDYGVNWNKVIQSGTQMAYNYSKDLVAGAVLGSTVGVVSNFGGAISLMSGNNDAKIYDTHKVITISGKAAKYFAGGEFGIRNITQNTSTVEFKEYGTGFLVTPEIDTLGNMRITIESEISSFSGDVVEGIPSLNKNTINTTVRIKEGETIALGGFVKKVKQEDIKKVPGLGSVPVLGALFRSKNYQNGQTDAVIFVTARKVSADDKQMKESIDSTIDKFSHEEKKWYQREKK